MLRRSHTSSAAAASGRPALRLAAGALGAMLLLDALRVFLPSLITIFGDAGSTPPGQLGGFALGWFAAGLVAAVVGRVVPPAAVRLAGAALLAAGSGALACTDGGTPQLYLAAVAVAGGAVFLVGCALSGAGQGAPVALIAGIAAGTALHALLGTTDLVWRGGAPPIVAQLVLAAAFLAAAGLGGSGDDTPAPARYWGAVGPAVLLAGVLTGATARAGAGPLAAPVAVGLVAGAGVAAVLFAARPRWTGTPWVPAVALPLLVVALLPTDHGGVTGYAPVAAALAALALAACLGWAARPAPSGPARRGFAAGGGLLGFGALVFGYYAAYDADLGFPNGLLLVLAAVWIGASVAPWRAVGAVAAGRVRWVAVVGALAVLAGVGAGLVVPRPGGAALPAGPGIRLVTYNIRMAYDLRGRFSVDRIAAALAAQHPDIVLLNEVDRGWFLNGGHDDLLMIADRLGMPYRFAPAADPVWGDAILTRLPLRRVMSVPLPAEGPTGAQALGAAVTLPGGGTLGVVATHFQPDGDRPALSQARAAAGLVRRLGGQVVLAGDLNSEPGSPAIAVLRAAGLTSDHQLASYPSNAPYKHIDHILTTAGVTAGGLVVGRTTASDHVPMATTLELR